MIEHVISKDGADIMHDYFVEKPDMSRAGLFSKLNDDYDQESGTLTIEAEVDPSISVARARKAVEEALNAAEVISGHAS